VSKEGLSRFQSHTGVLGVGSHTKDFIPGVGRHPTPKIPTQNSPSVRLLPTAGVGSSSWVTSDSLLLLL